MTLIGMTLEMDAAHIKNARGVFHAAGSSL